MRKVVVAAFLFALCSYGPARADFPEGIPDRIRFGLGGIFTDLDTSGAVGTSGGAVGAYINFEDAFDLPVNRASYRLDGQWRMKGKNYLDFGYVEINRAGARAIQDDIEYGGVVYTAGALVTASWESGFPYVAYRRNFVDGFPVRIGGTAGLSYLHLGAGLEASGNVEDLNGNPIAGTVAKEVSVDFPVPLIGVHVDWAFAKRWTWDLYYRFFYLSLTDFRGGMNEAGMRVSWFPTRHFGLGAGLETTRLQLKEFKSDELSGRFAYSIVGFTVYLKGTF